MVGIAQFLVMVQRGLTRGQKSPHQTRELVGLDFLMKTYSGDPGGYLLVVLAGSLRKDWYLKVHSVFVNFGKQGLNPWFQRNQQNQN